ncbi:hypothetical protein [Helicobacter sp. 11S02629-2]|uniref:hypothetical protein n=1 Tax=Helicobacter sp. 11S02629-2 TaxID=1476195 RepID=UPI000BA4F1AC|nr:hypothetical protein [Helicobacter sp. 11S02629-2]PAF45350.1 hypothetical protein BKH40_03935 [Helicobacter sp. 11S02629-2]
MKNFRVFIEKLTYFLKTKKLTSLKESLTLKAFIKKDSSHKGFKEAFILPDLIYALIVTSLSYYTIFLLQSHITTALNEPLFTNHMLAKSTLINEVRLDGTPTTKLLTNSALTYNIKHYSATVGTESLRYIKFESVE